MTAPCHCVVCDMADDPRPVLTIHGTYVLCAWCAGVWEVRPTWRARLAGALQRLADRVEGRAEGEAAL